MQTLSTSAGKDYSLRPLYVATTTLVAECTLPPVDGDDGNPVGATTSLVVATGYAAAWASFAG